MDFSVLGHYDPSVEVVAPDQELICKFLFIFFFILSKPVTRWRYKIPAFL